jgi:hypothetical protein
VVTAVVVAARHDSLSPPSASRGAGMRMEGVRTVVYVSPSLQISASARQVRVEPPRLVGPFRVGFLHSIISSDVELDLVDSGSAPQPVPLRLADLQAAMPAVSRASQSPLISGLELGPVRMRRRGAEGTALLLQADRCATSAPSGVLTCRKGVLRVGGEMRPFAEATLDGSQWQITRAAPARVSLRDNPSAVRTTSERPVVATACCATN